MTWQSIVVQGALLPPDVLVAVSTGALDGSRSADYHLAGEAPQAAAARAWEHLRALWSPFREAVDRLPAGDAATGLTRDRWLSALFTDLGFGRLPTAPTGGLDIDGTAYPVSHLWGSTPIHLLGWNVDLDRHNPGVAGAARAPHAMVQELLNRSDTHLWAMVSNGRRLRLLRDSTSLTGQAYVEFDLESMFDNDLFADFTVLFLLCHESRVEVPEAGTPADCWLETWRLVAVTQGVRALGLLRDGVQRALEVLGTGFLQHPANAHLRRGLEAGDVTLEELHRNLLRVAYRLLFWAVAEDRDALLDPQADVAARRRYADYYSSARLRRTALRRLGSAHDDLWRSVEVVMAALSMPEGEPRLGLPGLGGLFSRDVEVLDRCLLPNHALLDAVRHLSVVAPKGQPRRLVDFAHLGAEELGGIYESLLELVPRRDPVAQRFTLEVLAGNERKTSGSYYTPTSLVDLVLDTALNPVLDAAEKTATQSGRTVEQALLDLRVCDPAIGSGHFMVAAARRIAHRVAAARTQESDPTPASVAETMHDVVARCVYGVDINPMAADLAKVSLWLEAMLPGRPLTFLDHHIKVGNALLGTTPALLNRGIPDEAYKPVTGDERAVAAAWRRDNQRQRAGQGLGGGQGSLLDADDLAPGNADARKATEEVAARAEAALTLTDIAWAAQRYRGYQADPDAVRARRLADAWCAAFLTPKTATTPAITHATLNELAAGTAGKDVTAAVDMIASRHRLFHWHLEFPEVFPVPDGGANTPTGWTGGFDAVLGNPPWERVKLQEQEFFAARAPEIANAKNAAARKKAIAALATDRPTLLVEFEDAKRTAEAESGFLRLSGRFPLCGVGDVNTYSVFAEHFRTTLALTGRSGIITPTGLATDATTAAFFADTVRYARLSAFYDFENEAKIFPGVHNQFRFAVSSMTGGERVRDVRLAFYTRYVLDVAGRRFALTSDEIVLLNPKSGTLPVFRSRRDAEITLKVYQVHPILMRDGDHSGNPWGLRFLRMFDMANDSDLFDARPRGTFDGWAFTAEGTSYLPLYEAKLLGHWNHRFATYRDATEAQLNKGTLPRLTPSELDSRAVEPLARYWVAEDAVREALPLGWDREWLFGWRDIARASDARTFVPSVAPLAAVGHVFPLAMPAQPRQVPLLQGVWSSLVFDYVARQKLSGTHMTYGVVHQLACPRPEAFAEKPAWAQATLDAFVRARVFELTYNSHRIRPYAVDVVDGDPGQPFRWLPDRRAQLIAELDAAMFHLYGLDRPDVEHVLDSFFVVRKNEERDHGEFRTKRLVLAAYDAMAEAARTGVPFASPLDPAPGHGPRHPA